MEDSTERRLLARTLAVVQEEWEELVAWLVTQRGADLRTLEAELLTRGHQLLTTLVGTVLAVSPAAVARGERPCPHCQQPLVDLGRRPKTVHLTLGAVAVRRVCGYCPGCRRTDAALDTQLGIDQSGRSPRLVETLALVGTELPFAPAAERLTQLCGVAVSASQVQAVTEAVGRTLEQHDLDTVERAWTTGELPALERTAPWVVVALDGVMVAQRDGDHEVRGGAITGATPSADPAGAPDYHPWRYVVHTGEVQTFGRLVGVEAGRHGVTLAERVLVLGDGAHWIWTLAEEHFPDAVQILDLWHATEHLWAAGRALYGEGDARIAGWVAAAKQRLLDGEVQDLLDTWEQLVPKQPEAFATECTYVRNQAHRMAYDQYRAAGYPLGSGAIESANRHVVGVRVKQAGMRWSDHGLRGVLALRALLRSQRWEQWWEHQPLPIPLAA